MNITYDEWAKSVKRDFEPIVIERSIVMQIATSGLGQLPETILYDRFFRAFVLERARKIVPVETLLANP